MVDWLVVFLSMYVYLAQNSPCDMIPSFIDE